MDNFPEWLQEQLNNRNWKQADLVRESKLDSAVISNILNRKRKTGQLTAKAIARALHLPPSEVFNAAGLLPPEPAASILSNRLLEEIRDWSDDEIDELLIITRAKNEKRKRGQSESKAVNRGV